MNLSPGVPLLKPIIQIACGGMHTIALASNGVLLSWGCNDDGALGRGGAENTPLRVDGALNVPVDGIAAGDCHTIGYNTQLNKVFYWGCYKVSRPFLTIFLYNWFLYTDIQQDSIFLMRQNLIKR